MRSNFMFYEYMYKGCCIVLYTRENLLLNGVQQMNLYNTINVKVQYRVYFFTVYSKDKENNAKITLENCC